MQPARAAQRTVCSGKPHRRANLLFERRIRDGAFAFLRGFHPGAQFLWRCIPMFKTAVRFLMPVALLIATEIAQSTIDFSATCTYRQFQIPGAYFTSVYGINNKGAIVGTYNPNSGSQFGYVWQNGVVSNYVYPGAAFTNAYGISDAGAVVGSYQVTLFGSQQGYVWSNGKYAEISYPGSLATYAYGMNVHGQIVGSYQDSLGISHGFSYFAGTHTVVDYPGAAATFVTGINNNGVMVGAYTDTSNAGHRFLGEDGAFTVIDYPGAANNNVSAVNDNNVIVGAFYNSSYSQYKGFEWNNGTFTKISDPADPAHTAATGINNNLIVVGNVDNSGSGFTASGCTN